jgi:Na+/proline symporter
LAQLPPEKLNVVHWTGGFADGKWIVTGLVGGAVLSMASHGVDHLIVQRLMAAEDLGAARKALMGDAVIIIIQFALFLAIGLGMFVYFAGREFAAPDEVFPAFVLEAFPSGLAGLMIAGILAAAMSTLASSINALASSTTHDIYAPLSGRDDDDGGAHLMRVAKLFTLMWGVILVGGAMLFRFASQGTPVVILALEIASFTYGGLLGGFFLGMLSKRATEKDAVGGIAAAVAVMGALWSIQQFGVVDRFMNGLWYSLVGSVVTVAVGLLSSRLRSGSSAESPA